MADDSIVLNPGVGGDVLDTESVTYPVAPLTRERERIQVTGAAIAEIARVLNVTPGTADYGLVVRLVDMGLLGTEATLLNILAALVQPISIDDNGGSITVDGAVAVSGTVAVTEPVSVDDNGGSLTVDGPLTDTELRATPVPISDGGGSVTVDGTVTNDSVGPTGVAVPTSATLIGGSDGGTLRAIPLAVRTDGLRAVDVADDFTSFEAQHVTLVASTDTTITFAQEVRMVRIVNWDTSNRVLVKDGAISSDADATATRVGKAPAADVPGTRTLPFKTTTIHLRSAAGSEVSVEGFF